MFKKFADGFSSTLAQAGEQAKQRSVSAGLSGSPRTSTSKERVLPAPPPEPYEEGNLYDDDEEKTVDTEKETESVETSPELQKKLNKLAKYEKKYPELLKAYRALQLTDSNAKAFEKVLGELTPATSVLDVEAFQQWANNFAMKSDLTSEELRRVSKELGVLKDEQKEQDREMALLKARIAELEGQLKEAENVTASQAETQRTIEQLQKSNSRLKKEKEDAVAELEAAQDTLRKEMIQLKVSHAQDIRKASGTSTPVPTSSPAPEANGLSKSQKKRQKKKNAKKDDDVPKETEPETAEPDALLLELDTLRASAEAFAMDKAAYEAKIKRMSEHQESVEEMRDMVKDIGSDLVAAKDRVKELEFERAAAEVKSKEYKTTIEKMTSEIASLKEELEKSQGQQASGSALQQSLDTAEEDLKRVTRELEITEKTSTDRFKELTKVRDDLRLQASEMASLRKDHQSLQDSKVKVETTLKSAEARAKALERAEKDRRDELSSAQTKLTAREKELKVIQTAFKEEEIRRKSEENRASSLKTEVAKLTVLRDTIISSRSEVNSQLDSVRSELEKANAKLTTLQQLKTKLTQERDAAQEELQMDKARYQSATSLMESQREQTSDMQHRMRDTSEKHEAMQEELSETQRQLTERARESETLRRLLSEIEAGQESRLREMRERMEAAIAERDKAEDEAAFTGKKRAREVEDLKEKLIDAERNLRNINIEKQDLSIVIADLRKAQEKASKANEEHDKDTKELRDAMSTLSHSLRESEGQIASLESERHLLRATIKETSTRLERLQTDVIAKDDALVKLRTERAIMLDNRHEYAQSPLAARSHNARTPSFSLASGSPTPSGAPLSPSYSLHSVNLSDRPKEKAEVDREYIKNVLFQFIEHKEKRKYLMPAISKLLLLNKQQEGTFVAALK